MKKSLLLLSLISVLTIACGSNQSTNSNTASDTTKPKNPSSTNHSDIGNQPKALLDKANNAVDKANADTAKKLEQANQ
ncbi:hypothetical protein MOMA_01395 [Moraxella macacae 0408225]|uniref:Lipoprotein n=1 Tax=Moraxella macacae 0408225 TaxID=1230338 RepID=L2F7L6_9GAMM|nr:hypothetical protein [Moraxella macacae]ELA09022.1 hypothetical protein MOMA_01395 [Moraxella macacae 0408225]